MWTSFLPAIVRINVNSHAFSRAHAHTQTHTHTRHAVGNTGAAHQLVYEAAASCSGRRGCAVPSDVAADLGRLSALRHPSPGHLSQQQQRLDWSMVSVGRWRKHAARGKVPGPLQAFAAAHHAGSIYVVGGIRAGTVCSDTCKVHALDLSTMNWRSVKPKGDKAAVPLHSENMSTAVWRTSICCFQSSGPRIHLFDMATETWSLRKAPWPRCVCERGRRVIVQGRGSVCWLIYMLAGDSPEFPFWESGNLLNLGTL